MSKEKTEPPKRPGLQKLWAIGKGIGMTLALMGGGYGTFQSADEDATRGALGETLDELEELREELQELRRQQYESNARFTDFAIQVASDMRASGQRTRPTRAAAEERAEVYEEKIEQFAPPAPPPKAQKVHVKKARQMLLDL